MTSQGPVTTRGAGPEAPAVLLLVGFLPSVVVAVRVIDALWMAAGVILVAIGTAVARSLLERPANGGPSDVSATVTGPAGGGAGEATAWWLRALVVSSLLTAAFEALLLTADPSASAALGIYAPLIAVNLLTVGAEASPPAPLRAALDALRRGACYGAGLVAVALVREVLGAGTITLFPTGAFGGTITVPALLDQPVRALGLAGGGLLCMGYLAAAVRAVSARKSERAT